MKNDSNKSINIVSIMDLHDEFNKKVAAETMPFYLKERVKSIEKIMLIFAEACALVMSIISANSKISILFVAPVTIVFSYLFYLNGDLFGKQAKSLILLKLYGDGSEKKDKEKMKLRMKGLLVTFLLLLLPFVSQTALRWVTRASTGSGDISNNGSAVEDIPQIATAFDSAFAVMLLIIPLCVFIISALIEIVDGIYEFHHKDSLPTHISFKTREFGESILGHIDAALEMIKTEVDARRNYLQKYEKYSYETLIAFNLSQAKSCMSDIALEVIKSKEFTDDELSIAQDKMNVFLKDAEWDEITIDKLIHIGIGNNSIDEKSDESNKRAVNINRSLDGNEKEANYEDKRE